MKLKMKNNHIEQIKRIVQKTEKREITDLEAEDIENRMDVLSNLIIDLWLDKTPEEWKKLNE